MRWVNVDPRFGASMNPSLTGAPTRERQGMGVTIVDHSELEIPVFWGAGDGLPHLGFYEPSLGCRLDLDQRRYLPLHVPVVELAARNQTMDQVITSQEQWGWPYGSQYVPSDRRQHRRVRVPFGRALRK